MKLKLVKSTALLAACTLTLGLVGCGATASDTKSESSQSTEVETTETEAKNGTEMITVTDARGEVEIPANPQRIVDISGNSDILSILGYSVIGSANSDAYDSTKFPNYLEDVLSDAEILGYSMQAEMDMESILALEPDMIVISSVQEGMYDQLQEVAPTVMIELAQIDWTEDLIEVAGIFDKEEEAAQWLLDYKAAAEEQGAKLKETYGEDTTYLAILASAGNIYIFDKAGFGSVFYDDMGLAKPEGMPEQTDISLPVVTYEGLAAIDADHIIAIGTEEDLAALNESTLWKNMPAVKAGQAVELPAESYFNMGYSAIGKSVFINEISDLMEK